METENAIKGGARHSAKDQQLVQEIHDRALELGAAAPQAEPLAGFLPMKTEGDGVAMYGGAIKTLKEEGDLLHVGGYLVLFGDENHTDSAGDYFTPGTDFGSSQKSHTWFHHTLPVEYKGRDGKRKVARITREFEPSELTIDDIGVFAKSVLDQRNAYEKMVADLVKAGKLGYSSGTAPHLIKTTEMPNGANRIDRWILGDDASYEHLPAEPQTRVIPLKTLQPFEIELPEAEPEVGNNVSDGDAAIVTQPENRAVKTAPDSGDDLPPPQVEVTEMTPEEKQELLDAIKASSTEAAALAIKTSKEQTDAAIAALKNEAPTTPEGGVKTAPAHLKTGRGDDAFKAFTHFIKTGDAGGIHTGEAYENYMKTDYHLVEGTQYQGQEAVPTEVYAGIVKKRNTLSFARMGGAQVYPANSNALNIPVEKAQPQNWTITAADAATASATLTQQPLDKLAATLYVFTYNLPYHYTLIDDATFNVEGWGTDYVARGLARTENAYFSMGTGSGQPQGAVYGSTLGVTAASATAVTAAEVAALLYKLDAAYQDNVIWAMLTATHGTVRALANPSNGFAFIGNGGYSGGAGSGSAEPNAGWLVDPRTRVFTPNGMDSLAASKKPIFAGNLNAGYAIVERQGLTVLRDPYSQASEGNVNVWFRSRFSGGVVNADALQHIATPSA